MFISCLFVLVIGCNSSTPNEKQFTSNKFNLDTTISESSLGNPSKCDIELIKKTEAEVDHLSDSLLLLFLQSFDKACINNVEFIEYSNEILFKVVTKYTERVTYLLDKPGIDRDLIVSQLKRPITDEFSTEDIIESIRSLKSNKIDQVQRDRLIKELSEKKDN